MTLKRCSWAKHPLEIDYHDNEWCRPTHNDDELFEWLILEGMQAGLSWLIVLKKRDAMRAAFDGFNPHIIERYDDAKVDLLLQNSGIIRSRRKLAALATNARAFLEVQKEHGTFSNYLWQWVDGTPLINPIKTPQDVPAKTALSAALSDDMKKRGFKFVGPVICYSFMQAAGLVDDHEADCPFKTGNRK